MNKIRAPKSQFEVMFDFYRLSFFESHHEFVIKFIQKSKKV
jgi:hypothetical protein